MFLSLYTQPCRTPWVANYQLIFSYQSQFDQTSKGVAVVQFPALYPFVKMLRITDHGAKQDNLAPAQKTPVK